MSERAQHCVGERCPVPRPVVAAAVNEERRRECDAAGRSACDVGVHAFPGAREPNGRCREAGVRNAQIGGDNTQVVLGQSFRPGHQLDVGIPELPFVPGVFDQFRRTPCQVAASYRSVAEYVTQAISELVASFGNGLVGGPAMWTIVAAVLDQGDACVGFAKNVIDLNVDRTIKTMDG